MARCARIWNFELFGQARRNELKSVGADHVVAQRLFDFRHVAGGALAGGAVRSVMGMLGDGTFESGWFGSAARAVARHAQSVSSANEI